LTQLRKEVKMIQNYIVAIDQEESREHYGEKISINDIREALKNSFESVYKNGIRVSKVKRWMIIKSPLER